MTMVDLDERLRLTARRATSGLALTDPGEDALVLVGAERRPRHRRVVLGASLAVAAAAAAVLGVVVWSGADDATVVPLAADGASADNTPEVVPASPSQRLSAAIAATLASDSFEVRTVAVGVTADQRLESVQTPNEMPLVGGAGDYGDLVHTVDGDLVATRWTAGSPAVGVATIRDVGDGTSSWQVAPGVWERAPMEESTVVDLLATFASHVCAVSTSSGDPDTLLVTAGSGACQVGQVVDDRTRQQWTVLLRSDGRIDRMSPVRDDRPVMDPRSEQVFSGYDTSSVALPEPARVTEVPTPLGSYIDSATGYTKPMYTNG
jgi:hypothetical protein